MSDDSGVSELVRALDRLSLAIEQSSQGRQSSQGADSWEVVAESEPARETSSSERQLSQIAFGDYNTFAEHIPEIPRHILRLGEKLRGGSYSGEYRIRRAWEAGFWAGLTVQEKIPKPRGSLPIDLRPTSYVVLRAPGLQSPTRVSSASDLYRITGRLSDFTVCHSFASLSESEAYCEAAGVTLPKHHQWS